MLVVGFILLFFAIVTTCLLVFCGDDEGGRIILAGLVFLLAYVSSGLIIMGIHNNEPTAIDVYRNRTTLEITYRDSIPVDTIVVFKN